MPDEEIELEEEVIEEEGLRDKLKKMRDDLKACRKEKEEYLAGWQRAKADFINARNEEERNREVFMKFAQASILLEFLQITDSLEMAMKHNGDDGIRKIYLQAKEILKQHGVTQIESEGKKFDTALHDAIEKVEIDDEEKDNMVAEDLQKGWLIFGKILRPAKVKVGIFKIKS